MKKKGYVKVELDTSQSQKKPRKIYTLTPEGRQHLISEIDELRDGLDSLKAYLDEIDADISEPSTIFG